MTEPLNKNIRTHLKNGISDIKNLWSRNKPFQDFYDIRLKGTIKISVYALIVGIIAGLGAVLFRYMIAFFHNLSFSGSCSLKYNSALHSISSFHWGIIFIPAAGILIVIWLTRNFAPEAKGHGVPEVMYSILENGGKIRPAVSLVKSVASAICIGSGGSVGREGPIVQIGAGFGSTLGQFLKLKPQEIITLVCTGVAGGIAATFNAPIGGVAFAVELMLPEFSILKLLPLVVASTVATAVSTHFIGSEPAFIIPSYSLKSSYEFFFYILLGFAAGFVAIVYIYTLYSMENFFGKAKINPYLKGAAAGLILGLTAWLLFNLTGHYYILGVGYAFITDTLTGHYPPILLLLLLVFIKITANALTLSGGGSGGVFAPSLFIGIGTGAVTGIIVNHFFPTITAPVSAYALVGMAAVAAGTTGASLTAIIMTFEMTRNYEIMLPLMLSVVIATFVTRFFYRESIYTKKLSRKGISIQLDKLVSIFKITSVQEVMDSKLISAKPEMSAADVLSLMVFHNLTSIPVIENNNQCPGTISFKDIFGNANAPDIKKYIRKMDMYIQENDNTLDALQKMEMNDSGILVTRNSNKEITGYITRKRIMNKYFIKRNMMIE
jgi:CIC family chloride channel protein